VNSSKDNVQLMIEAFTDFREGDDHSPEAADQLLRTLLNHSVVPTYQRYVYEDPNFQGRGKSINDVYRDFKANPVTKEEEAEIAEMRKLLDGRLADEVLYESHDDLIALLTTYPPVILEQLLVTGFVIYLLRADNVCMDSETDTFMEFYLGWGSVVVDQRG
jgi:hypothetical protein